MPIQVVGAKPQPAAGALHGALPLAFPTLDPLAPGGRLGPPSLTPGPLLWPHSQESSDSASSPGGWSRTATCVPLRWRLFRFRRSWLRGGFRPDGIRSALDCCKASSPSKPPPELPRRRAQHPPMSVGGERGERGGFQGEGLRASAAWFGGPRGLAHLQCDHWLHMDGSADQTLTRHWPSSTTDHPLLSH